MNLPIKSVNRTPAGWGHQIGFRRTLPLLLVCLFFSLVEVWAADPGAGTRVGTPHIGEAQSPVLQPVVPGQLVSVWEEVTWTRQLGFSYLMAYMFFLSICLGSLFLVIVHHLFDAGWSVPIRRFLEQIASLLFPWMFILFIPLAILSPQIYPWMGIHPDADHALHAKHAYLNLPFFFLRALIYFAIWGWLTNRLLYWSLRQDETGSPECTYKMRKFAAGGVFLFAFTLTGASIDWIKTLHHEWFSTMFGVWYFAGSIWVTLATAYLITGLLVRKGLLKGVVHARQFHDLGALLFAFTVFHAYITFSQYFIIWNANIPEETFFYVLRESGTWWDVGMLLIFGHFLVPFLALLRIDAKLTLWWMVPLCVWAWFMHYFDLAYNVMPVLHPGGVQIHPFDPLCWLLIGAVLVFFGWKRYAASAPYPIKDPRLKEAVVHHDIPTSPLAVATDDIK
jgi:hypothetical protein